LDGSKSGHERGDYRGSIEEGLTAQGIRGLIPHARPHLGFSQV